MVGKLPTPVIEALLETAPFEFSIVDNHDAVIAWNRHDTRIFKRPLGVLGKNVRDCHPKKSVDKVETILREMKAGLRDSARFWIDHVVGMGGAKQKILIEYHALRSHEGEYLGCMEVTQNITGLQKIEGEHRLLDM